VLLDAREWKLADERWAEIHRILATMTAALESGDRPALEAATAHLELAGPLRIIAIAAAGPPEPVRDQLNKLVHSLGGVSAHQRQLEPGDTGAASADSPRD
jgi:hypothetical protein